MNTGKIYRDSDGNECSIVQLVKREPHWAANRIQTMEQQIEELSDVIHAINCTEDSYDTEQNVMGEIYLLCESVRPDFEPDWNDINQRKYKIGWDNYINKRTTIQRVYIINSGFYFPSGKECLEAFKNISDEDLKYMISKWMV